jgi:hypothetical protein
MRVGFVEGVLPVMFFMLLFNVSSLSHPEHDGWNIQNMDPWMTR